MSQVRIEDAGSKIGGARKDTWRSRALDFSDHDAMTPEERVQYVVKDHVWPVPDFVALVENGMPPIVAAGIKFMRDNVPKHGAPGPHSHTDYIKSVGTLRDLVMACKSVEDLQAVHDQFLSAMKYQQDGWREDANRRQVALLVLKKGTRLFSFAAAKSDAENAATMGFPSHPDWQKRSAYRLVAYLNAWAVINSKGVAQVINLATPELAIDWIDKKIKAPVAAKTRAEAKSEEPERPALSHVERTGGRDVRNGRDISSDAFVSELGFRGLEFGNYVPQVERQALLNLAYDATVDFADVLGVEPEALSLGGRLAVAFGARGKGGHASAHYEPGLRVINYTRKSGAGSTAHEFGHAIDHLLGDLGDTSPNPGEVRSFSGWHDTLDDRARLKRLRDLDTAAATACLKVFHAMTHTPITVQTRLSALKDRLATEVPALDLYESKLSEYKQKDIPHDLNYIRKATHYVEQQRNNHNRLRQDISRLEVQNPDDELNGLTQSSFYKDALKLANGNKRGYNARPTEMLARAFECWVNDRLAERGILSQYLVQGVDSGRYAGEEFKGDPYPSGKERVRINAAFDELRPFLAAKLTQILEEKRERETSPRFAG